MYEKLKKELSSAYSPDDFSISPNYKISHRGGYFGFSSSQISEYLDIPEELLPPNIGAFCNYLGGGVRGSLQTSNYSPKITGIQKELLDLLLEACRRSYLTIEDESGMNSMEDENGETNWDALATQASRNAGIKSAY